MIDVCVIGAGIAGLSAAQELTRRGLQVVVLEKSRGLAGRAATRRTAGGRADHGAQHFTVRDDRFRRLVEDWLDRGHVALWSRGFHRLHADGHLEAPSDGHPRYICPEGMNTLGKLLADGLEVRRQTRASAVLPNPGGWRIELEGDGDLSARQVLIATPAEQARELLAGASLPPHVASALDAVAFDPCWAVMAGYPPEAAPGWSGVRLEADPVIAWVAHDSSKREDPPQTVLVLHSTPAFARAFRRLEAETAVPRLIEAAAAALGAWIATPLWSDHQRWRYALASGPSPDTYLVGGDGLMLCGDWCGGARIESAFLSGLAAAEAMA